MQYLGLRYDFDLTAVHLAHQLQYIGCHTSNLTRRECKVCFQKGLKEDHILHWTMNPRATGVIRMQLLWYLNSSQRAQRKPLLCGTKGEYQNCPPQDPKAPTANSMKAQDRRGQICTISQLKYYYRNQYIYHLNHFHKNEGFCWLDFKLGGNYQIFQVSEPRLLFGRQILGIRISNLSDNLLASWHIETPKSCLPHLGAIHKGSLDKTRISRPPSPCVQIKQ